MGFNFFLPLVTFGNSKHFHSCLQIVFVREERDRIASAAESQILSGAI